MRPDWCGSIGFAGAQDGPARDRLARMIRLQGCRVARPAARADERLDLRAAYPALGCSHVQGYVHGRPVDIAANRARSRRATDRPPPGTRPAGKPRMTMLRSVALIHYGRAHSDRPSLTKKGGPIGPPLLFSDDAPPHLAGGAAAEALAGSPPSCVTSLV